MTKHIAGIILFTFIVGTSAVIAGLLYSPEHKSRAFVFYNDDYSRCRKKKKRRRKPRRMRFVRHDQNVAINQAVFDTTTNLFAVSHADQNDLRRGRILVYHFYVKDENGTRHVRSERVSNRAYAPNVVNDFIWLANRTSRENLYVAAEIKGKRSVWNIAPKFENSGAVPVLIKNGN